LARFSKAAPGYEFLVGGAQNLTIGKNIVDLVKKGAFLARSQNLVHLVGMRCKNLGFCTSFPPNAPDSEIWDFDLFFGQK